MILDASPSLLQVCLLISVGQSGWFLLRQTFLDQSLLQRKLLESFHHHDSCSSFQRKSIANDLSNLRTSEGLAHLDLQAFSTYTHHLNFQNGILCIPQLHGLAAGVVRHGQPASLGSFCSLKSASCCCAMLENVNLKSISFFCLPVES